MGGRRGWALGLLLVCGACAEGPPPEDAAPPPPLEAGPLAPAQAPAEPAASLVGWVRQYGTAEGYAQVQELGSDRAGNLVLLASGANLELGSGPLAGTTAFALARYTPEGAPAWVRNFPLDAGFAGPSAAAVAVAPAGDSFVGGNYTGAPDLGAGALPEAGFGASAFLARFAPDGRTLWSRAFASHVRVNGVRRTGFMVLRDLALDAQGNLLVTGSFQGAVDFGTGRLGSEARETQGHFFLAKLSADGTALWATAFEEAVAGADLSYGTAVAADPTTGHVLVAGAASPGEEVSGTAFVARFTPDGRRQWLHRLEGEAVAGDTGQRVRSLAVGPEGSVYFAGDFSGTFRFAGKELESRRPHRFDSGAGPDLLLGAFDSAGTPRWARALPGLGEGTASQLFVEPDGGLLLRGELLSVADLGTGPLLPGPILARLSADGATRAALTLDPRLQVAAQAPQPGGRTLLAAVLFTPAQLDGRTLVPVARQDVVLVQLDTAGLPERAPALPPAALGDGGALGWHQRISVAGHALSGSMDVRALAGLPDGGFAALGRSDSGTFGGPSLVGERDLVLARYDAQGALQWTRSFRRSRTGDGAVGLALAATPTGELLVAGTYSGAPDLGGGALPRAEGSGALFLARFGARGRHLWSRGFVPTVRGAEEGNVSVGGLAAGPEGDALLTGAVEGRVDLGAGPLGSAEAGAASSLIVARFDSAGRTRWSTALAALTAGAQRGAGTAVALGPAGEAFVAGMAREAEEDVGTGFIVRLGAQGEPVWVRRLEATRLASVRALAAGAEGTVYFGGELRGTLRFASQTLESKGAGSVPDVLLGALAPDGAERWARELPEAGEGFVEQLALDGEDRLTVRGLLLAAGDLGLGTLQPGPFVARYAADGTPTWTRTLDRHIQLSGLALQPRGRLVVAGSVDAEVELDGERILPEDRSDLLYLQLLP
ncbi:hypothetical protein FGE12_04080 [Aggregicoccus sp. 17bor-14]|uniref:hypothetical protein n=1 Tax=Myxococcaceae TaxID=31 RepID=UPI00129D06D8|nr:MULTISPECIES: hypothetical protein [Myxococcaceae]MBF5041553.1 hypothetical protein [Simulacricoccus sp. 17bor-14]MRI87338.1 hypothetical protein [Aggregicoccus sp. 17bor-14]